MEWERFEDSSDMLRFPLVAGDSSTLIGINPCAEIVDIILLFEQVISRIV